MNSGRRGRRTRRRPMQTAQVARQNSKAITRIAEGQPYEVRCSLNPPPISTVTTVTRTVELVVIKGASGTGKKNVILYGNASTPCVLYLELTNNNAPAAKDNKRYEFGLDFENLTKMLASRFSRSADASGTPEARIDPPDMFSYLRLDKVCMWGPAGQNQIGFPVQLTVYNAIPTVKSGNTFTIGGEYSARSTGDRFRRARVAISNLGGKFIPVASGIVFATGFDLVQFLLGWNVYGAGTNFGTSLMDGDVLAVLHITLTGQCGRDVASMLSSIDLDASTSIEVLRDDCASASSLRSRRRY